MKTTALTLKHIALGAKMVEFAGYNMPVSYSGLNDEHLTVRSNVGIFDVSHMGEFIIQGPEALNLIQRVTTNDASAITPGKAQYSCMPNATGGIVDDLLVYRMSPDTYMLVVNASNIEKDWNWISSHNSKHAEMKNVSDDYSLMAVQGPRAIAVLSKLTTCRLNDIPYYSFAIDKFCGFSDIIISNTGYTGAGGFEIYCKNNQAAAIWDAVLEAGKSEGIKPIGLGARDTLRLEMAFCLYGNDIDDTTSPIEAGLGWITKFTKQFTNSAALKEQKERGVKRKLVGFTMSDKAIPRHGYVITDAQGIELGIVTSGTQSPSLQIGIGLGYVKTDSAKPGSEIYVRIREKLMKAVVVKTPFYKNEK